MMSLGTVFLLLEGILQKTNKIKSKIKGRWKSKLKIINTVLNKTCFVWDI